MEIVIPEVPAAITALLSFGVPYVVALINGLAHFTGWAKRGLSVVVSLVFAGAVIAFYYFWTGDVVPDWPALLLLSIAVSQSAYALVIKNSVKSVENSVAVAQVTRQAGGDPHNEGHSVIPAENEDSPTLEEVGGYLAEDEPPRGKHAEEA